MDMIYQPYNAHPDFESLIERIHPPRVCIDNDTCPDKTLIKVDSANKHGILLEMVQVLTDLDLLISKSYISSDGGWFMDVFHVTDQRGRKLKDENLILYIQQALCVTRKGERDARSRNMSTEYTAIELTGMDGVGLLSEISTALFNSGYNIVSAVAWTHNARAACIIKIGYGFKRRPVTDPKLLAEAKQRLEKVVGNIETTTSVKMTIPAVTNRIHTERRLHQLMYGNGDYERCRGCDFGDGHTVGCVRTHVTTESCPEKEYMVVHVKSKDRPKLLFDTVCALTDMDYVVFHAAINSKGLIASQEYFIRQKDGKNSLSEIERRKFVQCLVAAIERRTSQGLKLDLHTKNRIGLLSDITKVFRQNGLSISKVEINTYGEKATGSFYVVDITGVDVSSSTLESVKREIGVSTLVDHEQSSLSSSAVSTRDSSEVGAKSKFSLGGMLRSKLGSLSSSFRLINS